MGKASFSNEMKTLVLVGRTGNGKSATGNNILGRRAFKSKISSSGVTSVCELQTTTVKDGPIINVIDTPGLFDGTNSAGKEIVKCIDLAKDGIHAIILVFSVRTRFSEEEQATFLTLQALFGHKIVDYMLVVFTGGDDLEANEETLDDYLDCNCPQPLQDILTLCGNRKVLFNNRTKDENERLEQVQQLLNLVDEVMLHNAGQPFTNELFKRLKEKATETEKAETLGIKMQLQKRYDDELKRMTDLIESKLNEEIAKLMKMLEEEKVARLKAEENYKSIQTSSNKEIQKLQWNLQEANKLSLETLKMLYMKNQNFEKLWQNNCHSKSFYELEYLTLSSNKKLLNVISSNIIIRLNKLKKLTLEQCEVLTEIFYLEDDKPTGNIQELLPQLQELALSYLRSFTCIWNMEPSVSFFPNLLSLHIVHCGTLQSLFSISSTKNLQNLKSLKLCNCDKLEEVISIDNREDMTVSFPKMECLVLKDLPKLLSFHQQNGTIHLPNIQIMRARNIPSMKFFSVGIVITPLLRSIHVTFARKLWLGNLNETLSYISNNPGKFHFAKLFGFPS